MRMSPTQNIYVSFESLAITKHIVYTMQSCSALNLNQLYAFNMQINYTIYSNIDFVFYFSLHFVSIFSLPSHLLVYFVFASECTLWEGNIGILSIRTYIWCAHWQMPRAKKIYFIVQMPIWMMNRMHIYMYNTVLYTQCTLHSSQ